MIVRASPDWKVPTAARVQPPNAARSNFLEYELGRAYTMLNTNRFGRSKLERPHRCLGESWFPRVKAVPAPVPLMFAPSVSSAFENVYDARNCSPRLNCLVRLTSRPLYQDAPSDCSSCNPVAGMPMIGTRRGIFVTVLSVCPRTGLLGDASNAWFKSRVCMRWVPRVPTYPTSRSKLRRISYCTFKPNCWMSAGR